MSPVESFRKFWNRFFYEAVDAGILGYFRIGFGSLLLLNFLVLGPDWIRWFGNEGVLDQASARQNIDPDTWSFFLLLPGNAAILWLCFLLLISQTVLFLLGWKPRFQAACLFLWLLSLHHRNNLIWDGEDVLFRLTCFLFIFMPSDRFEARDRLVWPLRLVQIQLSFLYLSSVLGKLEGARWLDGSALYYVVRLEDFGGKLPLPDFLTETMPLLHLLTWSVIAVECVLCFGVWVPSMRQTTVVLGLAFHLALELTMHLFLFQWLMMLILSTHLRMEDWKGFWRWLQEWIATVRQLPSRPPQVSSID